MKRFLLVLGVVAGVWVLLWGYPQARPDAQNPLYILWSWGEAAPSQATPAVARETISSSEMRTMVLDLQMLRVAITEYLMTNDSLPRNFDDMEIPAPPNTRLLENGSIEYRVGGRPTARVLWRPRPSSMRMEWDCVSTDIVNLTERIPDCRYAPSFKTDEPIRINYASNHRLLFEFDRSGEDGLSAGERSTFQQFLAGSVRKPAHYPQAVQITGYADPLGDAKRNIRLAEGRAAYVREALAASGIDRSMISVRVIGADPKPLRDCPASLAREERIQCFGLSRRVDIVLSGMRDL